MIIVGLDRDVDTFVSDDGKTIPYDNFYVSTETTAKDSRKGKEHYGKAVKEFKIKAVDFFESFPGINAPSDVLGMNVKPYYNEYAKCCGFLLMNEK